MRRILLGLIAAGMGGRADIHYRSVVYSKPYGNSEQAPANLGRPLPERRARGDDGDVVTAAAIQRQLEKVVRNLF